MKKEYEIARRLSEMVSEKGGTAYYVGGCVRDRIRGMENKDIDIEVHGIEELELIGILDALGERLEMGQSFGIYGIKGYDVDIAMPRRERNTGDGHREFLVDVDPFIGTYGAAIRRDFTINALMENVLTGEIVDHFGGVSDIEKRRIRHVNDQSFVEDPLRVLRCAQFAARFQYDIAEGTVELCRKIDLSSLSMERVYGEVEKGLMKSERPSRFFESLKKMGQLDVWFPELEALIGVRQNPYHHSEGDAWVHTMMVLDEAVKYRDSAEYPLWFMLSCLVHDFGKAICTEEVDGKIISHNHEVKGLPIVQSFIQRISNERKLLQYVLNMTEHHMKPNILAFENASKKATNRMFDKAISPEDLIHLAMADGRGKIAQHPYISHDDYLYDRLRIYGEIMDRPYVKGQDLLDCGMEPGKELGKILGYAHKLRLAGVDKESALKQTLGYARTLKKNDERDIIGEDCTEKR